MNALAKYASLINEIFGPGTATFDTNSSVTNEVIGAWKHPCNFSDFIRNFTARLRRLKAIYSNRPDYLKDILVQVNEIANNKNWQGAFAELSAFDYLNQDILKMRTHIWDPIKPNETISVDRTFGGELGKREANLDGFVENVQLFFDVKVFKDNVKEILEGIYKEVYEHFKLSDLLIQAQYSFDISYDDFRDKRRELLKELKEGIDVTRKPPSMISKVIANLSYNLLWMPGIISTVHSYDPYSHAKNFHKLPFNYANKFVKDSKSLIVLVVFPWYNGIVTDFNGNSLLYRSLARRFFCQYVNDSTSFKNLNRSFTGTETMYQVSKYLSGIIFLEDNAILSKKPNETNVKSYVYLNPNAENPINRSLARGFLMGLHNSVYDDFEFDNY